MSEPTHLRKFIQTKHYDLRSFALEPEKMMSEILAEIEEKTNSLIADGLERVGYVVRNVREKLSNPNGFEIYVHIVGMKKK